MLKCASLLDRDLRTVAPRVEYWRQQRPGQALQVGTSTFTLGDATFCARQRLSLPDFQAFKAA